MKIKHLKRYFIGIAVTALLGLLVGNAFADKAIGDNATRDFSDGEATTGDRGKWANNYMVVSPYWQVEGGASYTFVAVTHSSLSGMASQIGVVINAISSAKVQYPLSSAAEFTVTAGNTQRVFIVPTNHSTINTTNIPTAVFIAGTTDFTYGHLRIAPQTSHPMMQFSNNKIPVTNLGDGFRDTTMLSYWGSIIVEANTTGFAMEFIGDMNDSQTLTHHSFSHHQQDHHMGTGLNLQ